MVISAGGAVSELSDAERQACIRAFVNEKIHRASPLHVGCFETGWLAARDYYEADRQAEREQLEEMVQKPPIERKPVEMPGPSGLPKVTASGPIRRRARRKRSYNDENHPHIQ